VTTVVLASASPRRSSIFAQLGIDVVVDPADVVEVTEGDPHEVAMTNALAKARAVARRHADSIVIAADTIVVFEKEMYGKPVDAEEARATLSALRGQTHVVTTAVAVIADGEEHALLAHTDVTFRDFPNDLLTRYIETGEWSDCAGGYAIQGLGAALVASVNGDWFNVVGFPVAEFLEMAEFEEWFRSD
jgi:septum formation protein